MVRSSLAINPRRTLLDYHPLSISITDIERVVRDLDRLWKQKRY
jgi:hypothetical protein